MATSKKNTPRYDLNAQDRRRDIIVKVSLTGLVIAFAVALVLFIVMGNKRAVGGEVRAVRLSSAALIKNPGTDEPKAVLSLYEDFQCPHCKSFEANVGPTVTKLIESGAVAVDYYMVSLDFLDKINRGYSTRSANAGYCVADETVDNREAFQRFRAALFALQPDEQSESRPDNKALIETARQAGVAGNVADCINRGRYDDLVKGLPQATGTSGTPRIVLNGTDITPRGKTDPPLSPEALIAKVTEIVGPVPGLAPVPPAAPASAP